MPAKKMLFILQCTSLSASFRIPSGAISHLQQTPQNKCLGVTKRIQSMATSSSHARKRFILHLSLINGMFCAAMNFFPSQVIGLVYNDIMLLPPNFVKDMGKFTDVQLSDFKYDSVSGECR